MADNRRRCKSTKLPRRHHIDAQSRAPSTSCKLFVSAIRRSMVLNHAQVNLDEVREHNRQLADGSVINSQVLDGKKLTEGNSLLQAPFDYSDAFDRALKNVVSALPNRPAKESSQDVVCVVD